jgi:hypothetical protein
MISNASSYLTKKVLGGVRTSQGLDFIENNKKLERDRDSLVKLYSILNNKDNGLSHNIVTLFV